YTRLKRDLSSDVCSSDLNFGTFLDVTIDFQQVNDDQLFLISGKTGSGKTMIFDAIVFALFGEASTKDRSESDLRSHFADGKTPMSVEFEFKLRNTIYKINRQGAFVKEGNKNKTLGQLSIYQLEDTYELRESKVNAGNQFIRTLLGVNSEQFRQLFILPQGEFKRFLLSKSIEKQEILRTLFNSQRFEEIQAMLNDDVKKVRIQIEKRYHALETDWEDLETFNMDTLNKYKEIIEKIERQINTNLKLQEAMTNLEQKQTEYNKLLSEENNIQNQMKLLKEINEVRPLANLFDTKEKLLKKHDEIKVNISKKANNIANLNEKLQKNKIQKTISKFI